MLVRAKADLDRDSAHLNQVCFSSLTLPVLPQSYYSSLKQKNHRGGPKPAMYVPRSPSSPKPPCTLYVTMFSYLLF